MTISTLEQIKLLNEQIKNIYDLISSTHKYYATLCSSIIGIAIALYYNRIEPTEYFNYFYYVALLIYALSIVWYRNLMPYLYDLCSKTDDYNKLMQKKHIISMYNLSKRSNVRKVNLILPLLLGTISCLMLIKYTNYYSCCEYLNICVYIALFILGFLWKIDFKIIKNL